MGNVNYLMLGWVFIPITVLLMLERPLGWVRTDYIAIVSSKNSVFPPCHVEGNLWWISLGLELVSAWASIVGGSTPLMRGLLWGERAYEIHPSSVSQGCMDTCPSSALSACSLLVDNAPVLKMLIIAKHDRSSPYLERFLLPRVISNWSLYYGS